MYILNVSLETRQRGKIFVARITAKVISTAGGIQGAAVRGIEAGGSCTSGGGQRHGGGNGNSRVVGG